MCVIRIPQEGEITPKSQRGTNCPQSSFKAMLLHITDRTPLSRWLVLTNFASEESRLQVTTKWWEYFDKGKWGYSLLYENNQ